MVFLTTHYLPFTRDNSVKNREVLLSYCKANNMVSRNKRLTRVNRDTAHLREQCEFCAFAHSLSF